MSTVPTNFENYFKRPEDSTIDSEYSRFIRFIQNNDLRIPEIMKSWKFYNSVMIYLGLDYVKLFTDFPEEFERFLQFLTIDSLQVKDYDEVYKFLVNIFGNKRYNGFNKAYAVKYFFSKIKEIKKEYEILKRLRKES